MMEEISTLAVIVSLSLTCPYICYCFEICHLWQPSLADPREPSRRLSRGIFYGFFASGLDNVYWWFAWLFYLFNPPVGMAMVGAGSLANIFFRQLGGIYAAREHLIAANILHRQGKLKHSKLYWGIGFACFFALMYLVYIR